MKEGLKIKLQQYIAENNPEIVVSQRKYSVVQLIEDKAEKVMSKVEQWMRDGKTAQEAEEQALLEMTAELRPSRFQYLRRVMQEEFPAEYDIHKEIGDLTSELVKLIEVCREIFEVFEFSEATQHNRLLRHGIIAKIADHLN